IGEKVLAQQQIKLPGPGDELAVNQRAFSGLPWAEQKKRALFRQRDNSVYHVAGMYGIFALK
ncbi:MAG: hypothetical protein ACE5G1_16895, partial [bacterium]